MPGIECVGQVESECPKRLLSNSRGQAGSAFYKSTSALWSSCLSHKEVKASFWFLLFLDFCVTKMTLPHCVSSQLLGLPEKWEQCFHGMHAKLLQYLTDGVLPPVWRQFLPRNSVYQLLWSLHQSYNHGRLPLCFKGPCCDDRTGVIQAPQRSFISQTQSDGVIGALPTVHMEARSWGFKMGLWSGCLKLSQTKGSYPVHEGHDAKFTVMPIQQHHLLYAWQYLYSFWLLAVLA